MDDLDDYTILEILRRLSDDDLMNMCVPPLSKKINRVCKLDGDIQKRINSYVPNRFKDDVHPYMKNYPSSINASLKDYIHGYDNPKFYMLFDKSRKTKGRLQKIIEDGEFKIPIDREELDFYNKTIEMIWTASAPTVRMAAFIIHFAAESTRMSLGDVLDEAIRNFEFERDYEE